MRSIDLPIPGIVLGHYPERRSDGARPGEAAQRRRLQHYQRLVAQVQALDAAMTRLDLAARARRLQALRPALATRGFTDALVAETFALMGRACLETLGQQPYATQFLAAAIMLDGRLAEMATGEGKTLATGLCAATAALAGIPVHVLTANDYLVTRDAAALAPLFRALGLSVGTVTQSMASDARRQAYACHLTYVTAREVAFDYLRDQMLRRTFSGDLQRRAAALGPVAPGETLLRGLCMAIVDEADSVLIDDAGMPLVLSERRSDTRQLVALRRALDLARRLGREDFSLQPDALRVELTPRGQRAVAEHAGEGPPVWLNRLHREEAVALALAALHLFQRDRHYLVVEGAIGIIDEMTGRLAHGRIWSRGLHQLIELKEGCRPSGEQVTAAQITFQRFFRRYLRLAGSSGTLTEARAELRAVYDLRVIGVPLRQPNRRRLLPARLYRDREACWCAVAARALTLSRDGRPVLIGTDSVADSEQLAQRLRRAGVEPAVLNARQDAQEAALIAGAGRRGTITVATNMAGRGTDIALEPGVAARGGLHVISCQFNSSPRIDRQLFGRCARQGDPGSAETMLAVDHPALARWLPRWLRPSVAPLHRPRWLVEALLRLPQWLETARRREQRQALLRRDRQQDRGRAFGRAPD